MVAGVVAALHLLPIGRRPVHPTAVVGLGRVVDIAVVVQRADLIAQVDERNAADAEDDGMDEADAAYGQLDLRRVAAAQRALQPRQRSQRAGNAGVTRPWVLLEGEPAGKRALEAAGIEGVEEAAVVVAVDPQRGGIAVVKGPADVVVDTHVVYPGALGLQCGSDSSSSAAACAPRAWRGCSTAAPSAAGCRRAGTRRR